MYTLVAVLALVGTTLAQNCGQTPIPPNLNFKMDNEIVGGSNAVPYSWPWQCTWCRGTDTSCSLMCGCSVIDNNWVLTAAHCCQNQNAANIRVRAGVYQYSNFTQGTTRRIQGSLRIHPNYNGNTLANDICLAQLSAPLDYGDTIQPVCLPSSDDSYQQNGNNYYVTGWGTTSQGGSVSPTLRQVSVPYVDYNTCNNAYASLNYAVYQDTMVCAGVGGKDSCQGDSGGPMVYNTGSQWVQLGIVSWGYGCAVAGYPGVYARTSAFCNFISSITNNAVTCTIAGKHQ